MILRWLAKVLPLGAALLPIPAGIGGLYAVYQNHFSTAAQCAQLRGAILAVLAKPVDATAKQSLVHQHFAEYQRLCALADPDARAVFAALDRHILFANDPDKARPVRFVPLPPPRLPNFERPGPRPMHLWLEQRLLGT